MNLPFLANTELASLPAFVSSLAIGLVMGLERERSPAANAGLRTFALTGLLGTLSAMLAELSHTPLLIGFAMAGVGVAIISSYFLQVPQNRDPGTTTQVALLLCFGLGVLCWYDNETLAVMLGITATLLLYFKTELSGMSKHLSRKDLFSILQFSVLSFVILPVLPNQEFGPYQAFNPYQTWMMVVLISGVGLAGFVLLRVFGTQMGTPLLGLLGGMVSSTATTLSYARHAHEDNKLQFFAANVIVLANLTIFVRLIILGSVVSPDIARPLITLLGTALVTGLVAVGLQLRGEHESNSTPEIKNPTELGTALTFGLVYAIVLFCSAWLNDIAGSRGIYLVALASGLTDVDAITLSCLRLFNQGRLPGSTALIAIALAVLANTGFKLGLILSIGGWQFAKRCAPVLLAATVGLLGGMVLVTH